MRPRGPAHRRPPQRPRPAVVFASFRLRLGSGTTPRLPGEKGAQRDDRGAGCEEKRGRGDLEAEVRGGTGGVSEARIPGSGRGMGPLAWRTEGLRFGGQERRDRR
ncbi:hypothetical protein J1605_014110 [Eschrichtius robustus]|uniref:Uncharacterized protein n=1 Tax=Eschrichtius robustus TaxID=9764 RepID=A0AB34GEU0_ESCRO|nr:hypothetical protein J1605_014110 [Eschrichtius robustus]